MGVVLRGLVTVGVSVAMSVPLGVAPSLGSQYSNPSTPVQYVVEGTLIKKIREPKPERKPEPAREPLADAVAPLVDAVEDQATLPGAGRRRATPPPALPTEMDVRMVHANILIRMGASQFRADLREATAGAPDFVTLNEAARPDELLALPGYAFHRDPSSRWTKEDTVMWRTDRWEALSTGTRYMHRRDVKLGIRAVNWVTLRSLETGKVVSVVSTHASPVGNGPDLLPLYMSALAPLVRELSAQGPVFAGGDLNAHYGAPRFPRAGLQAAGLATTFDVHGSPPGGTGDHGGHTIDYLMYQPGAGVTSTSQWKLELLSDHDAVAGDFHLSW